MSGIYIHGMEMPADGHIILRIYADGEVCIPTECAGVWGKVATAIPAPEHGRLIDADALIGKLHDECLFDYEARSVVYADIQDMPTIIPADKEDE